MLHSECERGWQSLQKAGIARIKIDNCEVLEMGPGLAADRSTYTLHDHQGVTIDNGK